MQAHSCELAGSLVGQGRMIFGAASGVIRRRPFMHGGGEAERVSSLR
jgi:hypothetical protein